MIHSKKLEYICCTLTTAYGEAVGGSDGTAKVRPVSRTGSRAGGAAECGGRAAHK